MEISVPWSEFGASGPLSIQFHISSSNGSNIPTQLDDSIFNGSPAIAGDRLWQLVYPELRRKARAMCSGERRDHTLSATAVVNETYVRLSTRAPHDWDDRPHFYAVAASILRHVLIRHEDLTLPTSLLVDPKGRLQVIYLGPVQPEVLLADVERFVTAPVQGARRSLYGGRWYFRSPRDLVGLAADLRGRGLKDDARYYLALDRLQQESRRTP